LEVQSKTALKEKLRENFNIIKRLKGPQKMSLGFLVLLLLLLPLWVTLPFNRINSRSSRADTPATPPTVGFGQALLFTNNPAGAESFVQIPPSEFLEFPQDFQTIEMWFMIDSLSTWPNSQGLIRQNSVDNTRLTWSISIDPRGYIRYFTNSGSVNELASTSIVSVGTWNHLAISKFNGVIAMYLNGALETSGEFVETIPIWQSYTGIGGGITSDSSNSLNLNGKIDEVRISNIARYESDFNPRYYPFANDSSTMALYHFDNNFTDEANGNNGNPVGIVQFVTSTIPFLPPNTPTPIPLILLNSASGENCNTICANNNLSCLGVGTNPDVANEQSWKFSRGSCTEIPASCTTIMKKGANKYCSTYKVPWTYCKCN